jgi:protein involved in polysaccharide export with SLBB domain
MKTKLIFALACLFSYNLFGQIFPNYNERGYLGLADSSYVRTYTAETSEGSVDPKEYIIGAGDKLFIAVHGYDEVSFSLTVNQEGLIYIPKVGSVDLNNLVLADAKQSIAKKLSQYYKNVDIFVSLIDFRRMRISLLGNVPHPSTYTLKGYGRLIDLISLEGGLNANSNYRSITITNKNGISRSYDFLSFLRYGVKANNPLLQEGDIVMVDKVDRIISISGMVKYQGGYEFIEGEKVIDFINLAGGVLSKAKVDSIEIISFSSDGKTQVSNYFSLDELKNRNIILHNQDQVVVRQLSDYYEDKYVFIQGFVKYPGYYKIVENKTKLKDILDEAGGFRENAELRDATLYRTSGSVENDPEYERIKAMPRADMSDDEFNYLKAKSRQKKGRVVVDFEELINKNNSAENVYLKRNDVINVPEKKNYVIMLGQVVNQGNIIYDKNLTYEDYIKLAGGYGWRPEKSEVRVIKANTGEWIYADKVKRIEPGDAIWVPEEPPAPKFWNIFTTSLTIVGQTASIIAAVVAIVVASRK